MKKHSKKERIIHWTNYAPKYSPDIWVEKGDDQYNNNCYNYACDIKGTYAQPGLGGGALYKKLNCYELSKAAISDGLIPIKYNTECFQECHKVALTIWSEKTFHWYRLDSNGLWSHKPGDGPPTNLDYDGNVITDPRNANRGPFSIFCGCFCVCKKNIKIA